MSHTVKVTVEYKDKKALGSAVEKMGGKVLGEGTHRLFNSNEQGFGFTLPGWKFPLVLKSDSTLAFDDYGGNWGNMKDLDKIKEDYAIECVASKCEELGWYFEKQDSGELVIHHPDGGTITVDKGGKIDAACFTGRDCMSATAPIEEALGTRSEQALKPEYNQRKLVVGETE